MLMTTAQIEERLSQIPEHFAALRSHALSYAPLGAATDGDNNLLIGHNPRVGPEAYVFTVFAPAQKEWFERYSERERKAIPDSYRELLLVTNGCFAYDFSLFGLTPSMQGFPPLLARDKRQCHDLSLANRSWIKEFKIAEDQFYFGGRALSASENLGYFIGPDSLIQARRKSGDVPREWSDLTVFLREELASAAEFAKTSGSDGA
jgi:hypothetical protein